ncbi:MAG: lysoplasmalogenase [Oscillospiraceae bacterium]|nr:lysoplasmalogenase [Oscillospiraceae bacterium]
MRCPFWIIAAGLTCAAQVLDYFYLKTLRCEKPRQAVVWKAGASACFVLLGGVALLWGGLQPTKLLIYFGLLFGFAGDVVLDFRYLYPKKHDLYFALGAALFGLGHLCYITALLLQDASAWLFALPVCTVLLLIVKLYTVRRGVQAGKLLLPGTVYIAVTSYMASLAAAVAVRGFSTGTLLFAIGGALFLFSDSLLIAHSFGRERRFLQSMLLHIAYYLVQCLIAAAIFAL